MGSSGTYAPYRFDENHETEEYECIECTEAKYADYQGEGK